MPITMSLDEFILSHASDFIRMELAISASIGAIMGGSVRPLVQLDTEIPVAGVDLDTGFIRLRFNGRVMVPPGLTGEQLGDSLKRLFESLEEGYSFVWEEQDAVLKFTVVIPLLSMDPSLLVKPEVPEEPAPDDTSFEDFSAEEAPEEEPPAEEPAAEEPPPPEEEA